MHDPYLDHWWEFEAQDTYPTPDTASAASSTARRRSRNLRVEKDLSQAIKGVDALVLAVRHSPYLQLQPDEVFQNVGKPFAIVDCFCILNDAQIRRYFELGCEVKGMGRGHIRRIKDEVNNARRQQAAPASLAAEPKPVNVRRRK